MHTNRLRPRLAAGGARRRDRWWLAPCLTAIGLVGLFGYLTYRAFDATYVWYDPYISPAVAPAVFTPAFGYPGAVPVDHAWLGAFPGWWPAFLPQTPAFCIPWIAIAFRFTCYYYRGAYYKAFAWNPPACAVGSRGGAYRGERSLFVFQNLHRYTLYAAMVVLVFLWFEGASAFFRRGRFGIGVGTVVMLINAALLSMYTFGCHSWRHIAGGGRDCFSCGPRVSRRYRLWSWSSWLNARHMAFAWTSLVWVVLTDLYISLLARGVIRDFHTWRTD